MIMGALFHEFLVLMEKEKMEDTGVDPVTSRMLSERSTIWANPPTYKYHVNRLFMF